MNVSNTNLNYLDGWVDEYRNTYHHSIGSKHVNAAYSVLWEEIESNSKAHEFSVGEAVKITKDIRIFLTKLTRKINEKKYLLLILCWILIFELTSWKIRTEKIFESFYQ